MADASVSAESAMFSFDMQSFYTSWLRTIVDSQASDAVLNDCYNDSPLYPDCIGADTDTSPHFPGGTYGPHPCFHSQPASIQHDVRRFASFYFSFMFMTAHFLSLTGVRPADPSWGAAFDIIYDLLQRYSYAEGKVTMQPVYAALTSYVDYLIRVAKKGDAHLVTFHWYGDWLQPNQVASTEDISQQTSAFNYLRTLRTAINAATVLEIADDITRYTAAYSVGVTAYTAKWFNVTGSGCWGSGRQNEQVYPLYLSMLAPGIASVADGVARCLVPAIAANGTHVDTGIISTKYMMPLLSRAGRTDLALQLALQTDFPSWGAMIREFGQTAITEHWNPINNPVGASLPRLCNPLVMGKIYPRHYTYARNHFAVWRQHVFSKPPGFRLGGQLAFAGTPRPKNG